MIHFHLAQNDHFALIEFQLPSTPIAPTILTQIKPPDAVTEKFAHKGVILSGRGPLWLYGFLVHFYHPTRMVAVFDPRLQGAVIVAVHHPDYQVGMLIEQSKFPNSLAQRL